MHICFDNRLGTGQERWQLAKLWAAFFSYRTSVARTGDNQATVEKSKQLWGSAEIEGTNVGKALAKGLAPPEGATLFTDVTDLWRSVMHSGPRQTGNQVGSSTGQGFCGPVCGFIGGKIGEETFNRFVDPRYEDQTYEMARANWGFSRTAEPFIGPVIGAPSTFPPITLWP